jgi:hypothetical protein
MEEHFTTYKHYNHHHYYNIMYCNQKERVRKHTAHWLPSTNPGVHVLLIYSTQFRPSISHNTLTAYWLFQTNITRSKTYKCFASTQQQSRFYSIHLLPRPFTQMPARETLSLHYRLCTFPESTNLLFHQMFTKTPNSQCCLVSLSNSSVVAWPITRRSEKF